MAAEAAKVDIPAVLHLDHGNSYELAVRAMHAGYTSVMIDGSKYPLEENIEVSRQVARDGAILGIPVKAEHSKVGGKEDDLVVEVDTNTDPVEAARFVGETGISSLSELLLEQPTDSIVEFRYLIKRLSQIREVVSIPLVLHGASGVADEDVRDCIKRGICKVNFSLRNFATAYSDQVKGVLAKPDTYDPKAYGTAGIAGVKQLVMEKMRVCGCEGESIRGVWISRDGMRSWYSVWKAGSMPRS